MSDTDVIYNAQQKQNEVIEFLCRQVATLEGNLGQVMLYLRSYGVVFKQIDEANAELQEVSALSDPDGMLDEQVRGSLPVSPKISVGRVRDAFYPIPVLSAEKRAIDKVAQILYGWKEESRNVYSFDAVVEEVTRLKQDAGYKQLWDNLVEDAKKMRLGGRLEQMQEMELKFVSQVKG